MIPTKNSSDGLKNVACLDEARQAREQAKQADQNANAEQHGNRRFDAEKVARIKAAIAAGEYEIDPSRIADKFIEHDRNQ